MRHRLYAHVVWTTRDRAPLLDAGLARFLDRFLRVIAREERAILLEVGMVRTHVHLLLRYHPVTNLTRLLQRLKGASSAVGNRERHSSTGILLRWSKGYSIESVSRRALSEARSYVRDQALQHPAAAIPDWTGAASTPAAAEEEWIGEDRRNLRAGSGSGELRKRDSTCRCGGGGGGARPGGGGRGGEAGPPFRGGAGPRVASRGRGGGGGGAGGGRGPRAAPAGA